jgi:hypothetical protein
VHQGRGRVRYGASRAYEAGQSPADEGGHKRGSARVSVLVLLKVFPTHDADTRAWADAQPAQHNVQAGLGRARLTHQAERFTQHRLDGQAGSRGVAHPFVSQQQVARVTWAENKDRLFEARVEPADKDQIGRVLAVAVNQHPVGACSVIERSRAGGIFGGGQFRLRTGNRPDGDVDVTQSDVHEHIVVLRDFNTPETIFAGEAGGHRFRKPAIGKPGRLVS